MKQRPRTLKGLRLVIIAVPFALLSLAPGSAAKVTATKIIITSPEARQIAMTGGAIQVGSTHQELFDAATLCQQIAPLRDCRPENFQNELMREGSELVTPFFLDRMEVTAGDYQRCVAFGKCRPILSLAKVQAAEGLPAVNVSFRDATEYCSSRGLRLPSEAEFEFAARGRVRRIYPWGSIFHAGVVNGGRAGPIKTNAVDGFEELAPVDALSGGRTPEGVLQLAGNVEEWTSSTFKEYQSGIEYPGRRAVRGGHYASAAWELRAAVRRPAWESERRPTLGFRCAR